MASAFLQSASKQLSKATFKDFFLLGALASILTKSVRDKRRRRVKLAGVTVRPVRKKKSKSVRR